MRYKITILFLFISTLSFGQGNGLYEFIGKNGKYGFIDKKGIIKVQPKYLRVKGYNDGLCFVSKEVITKGYKWICIDTIGNEAFDIQDNFPETGFNEGFARISSFTEHWFINKSGKKVFNKTWQDGQGNFKKAVAYVSDIEFSDFYPIDTSGKRIGSYTYSRLEVNRKLNDEDLSITDTLIKFKECNLWGFKNLKNEVVIQPQYYSVSGFQNGICAVRLKYLKFLEANDWYFDAIINTKGEILNRVEMHSYLGFHGDLIKYFAGGHFSGEIYYLDRNGKKVIPLE